MDAMKYVVSCLAGALLIGVVLQLGVIAVEHHSSSYVSPLFCFNDTDNFKSDVCSKIGKQWSI